MRRWFRSAVVVVAVAATIALLPWRRWIGRAALAAGDSTTHGSTLPRITARPYSYRVPRHLDPAKTYPLVVALHGMGGRGVGFEQYFRIDELVDEMGFLAAFPDGTEDASPHHLRIWNATDVCCDFGHLGVDDVAYLDDVISDMSARFRVDPKRVFLVGHSNGGYMAHRFACDRASRVAAIVSSAGATWTDPSRCKPDEPVAVLEVHGTADTIQPYDGGRVGWGGPVKSARATVADWVALDHCAATADASATPLDLVADEQPSVGAETKIERWGGCRGVELWTVHGGAHSPRYRQPEFARAIGAWLLAHPKP